MVLSCSFQSCSEVDSFFSYSFPVSGAKAQEKVHDCALRILGSSRVVHEKVLIQEMESILISLVNEIRQLAKQALKMQIVLKAKSKKMTRCGKIVGNYNDLREIWLREVPLNEKLLEDFFDILYLQFDSSGASPGQMDRVVFHVMESLEIWNMERNEETESYSNKIRSYKSSVRTICYNVLRDSFRNCLVGDKSKRSERSHGIILTKHAKKEKMDWLSKESYSKYKISTFYRFGFQKEIHVKGWNGQKHRAWKVSEGKESHELVRLQYI